MPLDAICLNAVVGEIAPAVVGARIDKIQQPTRDQVVLLLRRGRLLLCANPNQPRLHLTEVPRENPAQPPMFCMLLRKHLQGGCITALEQTPLERVVTLTVRSADELGEHSEYRLILELMGRRANLILCGQDGRIIDCLRRVDLEMSESRQVLPGLYYRLPPARDKLSPLAAGEEDFAAALAACPAGTPLDKWLVDTYTALSPLVARELVHRAFGVADHAAGPDRSALWSTFAAWQNDVKEKHFTPVLIKRDDRPFDFTYGPVDQYGAYAACETAESFSALLDAFYVRRERAERLRQRGQDLQRAATTARDRVRRRIALQEQERERTRDRDRLRLWGELITANLYHMERGQTRLTARNYYEESCPEVEIPLDARLSPQENAARCFKQYTKAKTAERVLAQQLERGRAELTYLDSVLQELSQAETEQDFSDIRAELESGGYLRRGGKKQPALQRASKPREFRSSTGLRILVGRSNRQNDELTGRLARRGDIWLHTQKIHGSHVILCTDGAEPDERSLYEAAVLAAYYSQGRDGSRISVDYTPVRFVKKPAGSRPGMVVYTTYQTVVVDPDEALVQALRKG
ncbi:MAG: fibronectin/fibrinogen-binding protein [Ruminococcaceae bacterium]|nr:fibronectin/fibrinogen-binding protein [Oscillospiraceae bacterium]